LGEPIKMLTKEELPPVVTKSTTTTTTTTSTSTTTTTTTRKPPLAHHPSPGKGMPVGLVRIVGEVNVDENHLAKPVSVHVRGKKVNAELNVIPKGFHSLPGEVVTFHENPLESWKPHPEFRFERNKHSRKHTPVRPLHPLHHLIFKQETRDSKPHNLIDKAVDEGIKTVSNFAQAFLPGIFPQPKPKPIMHKFDEISPESPHFDKKKQGRQHLNREELQMIPGMKNEEQRKEMESLERGLKYLKRTDAEIPRKY